MGVKEDVLRALEYGRDPYYQAIRAVPSYQAELSRVLTDYNERTWIDFKGFFPKFTTEEFEKRRTAYQARYGNEINIPGFGDVIHIIPKARISAEERAAHIWAIKRGLPSPLTQEQQKTMQYKKFRFLKALASPVPTWLKNFGAVATVLDNVEDSLVTISFLGKIAAKIAPRLFGRLIPGVGWAMLGGDILNGVNLLSYLSLNNRGCKGAPETLAEKNPFHAKAKARRTLKLNRVMPSFGEFLEIAQTTDQLFGVGLCLGGLMGILMDTVSTVFDPNYWLGLNRTLTTGNVSEIAKNIAGIAMSDYDKVKRALQEQWTSFKDEAYRLKDTDVKLRQDIYDWTKAQSEKAWGWVKTLPQEYMTDFNNELIGSMIMSTGKDDFLKEDHTKAYMMLDTAIQGVMPWWIENDPLTNFIDLRNFKFRAPGPRDLTTIDMLDEYNLEWKNTVMWPHLNKEYATIEEIGFTYAPMIKDSFQTYALNYSRDYEAMIAAQQVVEFTKNLIRSFSDDNDVVVGMSAWWAVSEDMMREIFLIPPDTPTRIVDALIDYIGNYERQTAGAPNINDVARYGESIGIEWLRSFPPKSFETAAEVFPEWRALQDQFPEIFVVD